jgi:hypothetical protein
VQSSRVTFRDIRLSQPFEIANGTIASFTLVIVELTCADRTGKQRTGRGAGVLSVPWSWPGSALSVRDRDSIMRKLALSLTEETKAVGFADPIEHWQHLSSLLITKPAGLHGWRRIGESIHASSGRRRQCPSRRLVAPGRATRVVDVRRNVSQRRPVVDTWTRVQGQVPR